MNWSRVVALVAAAMLQGGVIFAQQSQPTPPEAITLTRQLMSPFCNGLLLSDCPSPRAADLRVEIASRIAAGESVPQVKADLIERFGPDINGSPDAVGLGLLVWWSPVLAGLAGLVLVGLTVRRSTRRAHEATPHAEPGPPHSAAAVARLDDELLELD